MRLDEYLSAHKVWHRFIPKPETIHTADAARVSGIELRRITKNLVFNVDDKEYALLIVPGDRKVDPGKAAKALAAKKIALVPFEKSEEISGYPPGGTPSIGHRTQMKVVLDRSLLEFETIYCGGGRRDRLLELRVQDVAKLTHAVIADISTT
jgi:Cys-tRNA(Pro)/Cys-tRNA(Cys) deacylase